MELNRRLNHTKDLIVGNRNMQMCIAITRRWKLRIRAADRHYLVEGETFYATNQALGVYSFSNIPRLQKEKVIGC
jgi:hypothetical protein